MKTNNEYKIKVEKEHGKPLEEIMFEYCVEKDLIPAEISSILNVPKSTIIQWRNNFDSDLNKERLTCPLQGATQ
ncbi:hypothetical protein SAMN04488688_10880 [Paenibacillus sp. cl141a]|uniref:hypothetical protein n=1 Tax=Paenibacillus sp. cl141a TaxID=1761877 RepID=UPI0008AFB31D|nr:hypothetical protein [Paenibacillus sp. cl141a]SEM04601.1 hypothetical protein SAMN04488688_10880 [Paenibacillus sp. cl141a]